MPHFPENVMSERPDGRQGVHNTGVNGERADPPCAARLTCGPGGVHQAGPSDGTCEFLPKDAARAVADDL